MLISEPSLTKLGSKMLSIMREVSASIPKTGYNAYQQYAYTTEADVAAACAKAFIKHQVCMFCSVLERSCQSYKTRGNKEAFMISVKLQITFLDVESGEQFTEIFFGDGSDADDKGVYKAITSAQKYALMKTFLITTGNPNCPAEHLSKPIPDKSELLESLKLKAHRGTEALKQEWLSLSFKEQNTVRDQLETLKQIAMEADQ
jgi:ERF superfamily